MQKLLRKIGFLVLVCTTFGARGESGSLLVLRYILNANVPYATGFKVVYGAPASVSKFKILQTGNYCDIRVQNVEYTAQWNDYPRSAQYLTDGYFIPEGTVYSLNIHFTQNYWDGADCDLSVVPIDGGSGDGGGGIWFELATIQDLSGASWDYTRRCGRVLKESLSGVQCYLSRHWANALFCKDPWKRKAQLKQFSCVRSVYGPSLEPASSIDWNSPL